MSVFMSCRSLHAAGQQGPTAKNRASFPFDNPLLVPTAAMAYRFDILSSHLHELAVFTKTGPVCDRAQRLLATWHTHTQPILRTTCSAGKRDSVGIPLKINVLPSFPLRQVR